MISKIISTNPAIMADEIQRLKEGNIGFQNTINELAFIGAKNINSYPYNQTTRTQNNVTFTDNGDGSITITTGEGGASANAIFFFHNRNSLAGGLKLINGEYSLFVEKSDGITASQAYLELGCTKNANFSAYFTRWLDSKIDFTVNGSDASPDYAQIGFIITVLKDAVIDNKTIRPMITVKGITDSRQEPFSKTNQELTTDVNKLLCNQTTAGTYKLEATVDAQGAITYEWVEVV